MIHVCSLSRLNETVEDTGARHVVSLIGDEARLERPTGIAPENISGSSSTTFPPRSTVTSCRAKSMSPISSISCVAGTGARRSSCIASPGISRSTASAYAAVCALNPERDENSIAQALRHASPTATPNIRIVSLADQFLGRDGRMIAAIETIGRGVIAAEATPFRLDLE